MKNFNLKNVTNRLTLSVFILTVIMAGTSCTKEKSTISTTKTNTIGTAPQVNLRSLKPIKDTAKMPAVKTFKDTAKMPAVSAMKDTAKM